MSTIEANTLPANPKPEEADLTDQPPEKHHKGCPLMDEGGKPVLPVLQSNAQLVTSWATIVGLVILVGVSATKFARIETIVLDNKERLQSIPDQVPPPELLMRVTRLETETREMRTEMRSLREELRRK